MDLAKVITLFEDQLALFSIEEDFNLGGTHYKIGCYRAPTGFYTISCACGWRRDTGTSGGNAHGLLRAHIAGHGAAGEADHA